MTFKEAVKKVKKYTGGEFFEMKYEYSEFQGESMADCVIHLRGSKFYRGDTWDMAFAKLNEGSFHPDQMPEGSYGN